MKRIGFFIGAVVFVFALASANTVVFANSCCGVKKDAHECGQECASGCVKQTSADEGSDNTCPVCGQAADSKDQQVDAEHDGKTIHLCCEGCANAYNENPDKYSKSEEPRQSYREKPKIKKKERGSSYY